MHWYSAASFSIPEMNIVVPIYCVRLSIMAGLGGVGVVSLGSVHITLIITGISIAKGRFTVQVRLNKDPAKMVSWE